MARTADQILKEHIGELTIQVIKLQASCENLLEQVEQLEAAKKVDPDK